jgi:hypothetical protein
VLVPALSYRLGRTLFDRRVGIVAAMLSTIAPFQVYYSQEARMHIWTTVLVLLAANALTWALDRSGDGRRWALFAGAGILGLYTFYYAGFALAGLSLAAAAVLLARRQGRALVALVSANGVVLLAFAPWALLAASRLAEQAEHKSKDFLRYDLVDFLSLNWKAAIAGVTAEPERLAWPLAPVGLALLLALPALGRARYRPLLPLLLVVPLLGVFVINLRYPHFLPRYLLFATPALYLLIAAGLSWPFAPCPSRRRLFTPFAAAAGAVFLLTAGRSLANAYFDPAYFRDDYRGVARTISARAQPDDVIILNAPWQIYNFPYYYKGPLPLVGLPHEDPLDPAVTEPKLRTLLEQVAGIWLVLYGNASMDPTSFVEGWLDEHAYKVGDAWYGGIRLVRYLTPVAAAPPTRVALARQYPGGLRLLGYELAGPPPTAGEPLAIRLFWQATSRPEIAYQLSLRLLDAAGQRWAQTDGPPLEGALPTDRWQPGVVYRDPYRLDLPAGLPPGRYQLSVVLYSERGEARPPEGATIGELTVLPDPRTDRPTPSLAYPARGQASAQLAVLGAELPRGPWQPGTPLAGFLLVRAVRQEPTTLTVLLGEAEHPHARQEITLPALRPGELRLAPLHLLLPRALTSGRYPLSVVGPAGTAQLGEIEVVDRPRQFAPPADLMRLDQPAGAGITLLGVAVNRSPTELRVRLVWRAEQEPAMELLAFLHLVDASERIVAQVDGVPGGSAPTTSWRQGEVVSEERVLPLAGLPGGTYRLWAGLYTPAGQRVGPGDGRLLVGELSLP